MDIIQISAELSPFAKVGGLGDVVYGLSRALAKLNHKVEMILPKYDVLDLSEVESLQIIHHDFFSTFEGTSHHNTIWKGKVHGIDVTLIESHDPYGFFERGTIYGAPDDVERFLYFTQAALEYIATKRAKPDILHLHDWHTAGACLLMKKIDALKVDPPKTILTLHNLAYQGKCTQKTLAKVGLEKDELNALKEQEGEGYNLLQAGILMAGAITTVSPNYAKEIMTTLGFGLEKALSKRKEDFYGILNGIDYDFWNPANDSYIHDHYSAHDLSSDYPFIEGKEKNKKSLRTMFSLIDLKRPLVSAITRLVPQKGPELIQAALIRTLENGGQFILLGSAMDLKTHDAFYHLKRRFAENPNVHIELTYNEKLSHLVYAASDFFIVPSIFEPCGLTQLIAMRYGTIPIVRQTGGLVDTVFEGKNGFSFKEATPSAMNEAIDRALEDFSRDPSICYNLIKNALDFDSSWVKSATEYARIYEALNNRSLSKSA